ncbi:Fc fragment of IgA and IgM receptor [Homo sapiens]|uniref:Fc alpha and mu receptor n=1 Tax=Homo sapiens TaxID=9606 RepID=F8W7R9_HUMAN|nr:Fc fragment of IgA and IgM receptor [Homo sapiens]KAI4084756.1 Fc fragment of IgA and IgM receptor [Homo sapiens]
MDGEATVKPGEQKPPIKADNSLETFYLILLLPHCPTEPAFLPEAQRLLHR